MPLRAFGLSLTDRPAVGLRHHGDRRVHDERRSNGRERLDRRRLQRRKARMRNLLFSAVAVALPPQMKPAALNLAAPQPAVSVTVEGFEAVPAREAYEDIIQEAADIYNLDPALIRSVIETESAYNASAVSHA